MNLAQQIPTPPRRGRGRPRGRRRVRSPGSDESDGDFTGYTSVSRSESSRHISLRSRSSHKLHYTETLSGSDDGENSDTPRIDGPHVQAVLCQAPPDSQGSTQYLVKLSERAHIHATLMSEGELRRAAKGQLFEFQKKLENAEAPSGLGHGYIEPAFSGSCAEHFLIDRVMAHRSIADDARIPKRFLSDSVYVPSLPLNSLTENENLMKWANPFYKGEPGEEPELFVGRDGVLTIFGGKNLESEKKEECESGREKIEYLVKWQGLQAEDATWELPESLDVSGELFTTANLDEFQYFVDVYWGKKREVPAKPLQVPDKKMINDYVFGRGIRMTPEQANLIGLMFEKMIAHTSCVVLGSGRMFAVCGFLELLRHVYGVSKPILIVADDTTIRLWSDALKMATTLYWIDYIGTESDRIVTRHHEFAVGERYDVVLTNADVISQEQRFLAWKDWSVCVLDMVHGSLPDLEVLKDYFTLVLSDDKEQDYEMIGPCCEPLEYTEEFVFVPNNFSNVIYHWLGHIVKSRGIRKVTLKEAESLAGQVIMSLSHPFMSPELKSFVFRQKKAALDLPEDIELTPAQEKSMFDSYATRLLKLRELVGPDTTSLVVASDLALLRMIYEFLKPSIPCGILDTPIKDEQVGEHFTKGVILMTRECLSPKFFTTTFDQVIYYDVIPSHKKETDLLQILRTKSPDIVVRRLILAGSLEADLYFRTVTDPSFNFKYFKNREAEGFLRIACLASQPDKPVSVPARVSVTFPEDHDKLYEKLCCIAQDTTEDDFWSRLRQPKDQSMGQATMVIVGQIAQANFTDWSAAASKLQMSVEEAQMNGRGTLLALMAQLHPSILPRYNIANAAIWFAFNSEPFTNEFVQALSQDPRLFGRDDGYWQKLSCLDSVAVVMRIGKMANYLRERADSVLKQIECCVIIRAFLEIRDQNYFPPRYVGSVGSPATLRLMLNAFLRDGVFWYQSKSIPEFASLDDRVLAQYFDEAYAAVFQDVLSFVYHKLGTDKESLLQYPSLRPIVLALERGPFMPGLRQDEINAVFKALLEFGVPLKEDGSYDWLEFSSLTRTTTISSNMTEKFASFLVERIPAGGPLWTVRDPQAPYGFIDGVVPSIAFNIPQRLVTLNYIRYLSRTPPREFRSRETLPETWDLACDCAIINGICQFGFSKMAFLTRVDITKYAPYPYDVIMTTSLAEFGEFLRSEAEVAQRLNWIILANCPVRRRIVFWANPVRHFSFYVAPSPPQQPPAVEVSDPILKQKRKRRTKQEMLEAKEREELERKMAELRGEPPRRRGRPSRAQIEARERQKREMAEKFEIDIQSMMAMQKMQPEVPQQMPVEQEPVEKPKRKPEPEQKPLDIPSKRKPKPVQKGDASRTNPRDTHITFYIESIPKRITFLD